MICLLKPLTLRSLETLTFLLLLLQRLRPSQLQSLLLLQHLKPNQLSSLLLLLLQRLKPNEMSSLLLLVLLHRLINIT
jgi:hypothetical protein